jgi:hypothetical protein
LDAPLIVHSVVIERVVIRRPADFFGFHWLFAVGRSSPIAPLHPIIHHFNPLVSTNILATYSPVINILESP